MNALLWNTFQGRLPNMNYLTSPTTNRKGLIMNIELAREKAAQVWCKKETGHIEMNVELAIAFADTLKEEVDRYIDALIWCSGSGDFGEGGQAREGWLKICDPLLRRGEALEGAQNDPRI